MPERGGVLEAEGVRDVAPVYQAEPDKAAISDVPLGYKRTEVGVIPKDWQSSLVGTEFNIQLGKMLDAAKNMGVPKPFIGNRSVQWGRIDLREIGSIPMSNSDLKRFRLRRGDLLVCEGGDVGRAAIWDAAIPECYYQKALHRLRPRGQYNTYLMMVLFEFWVSKGLLGNYVTQTSIAHLPKDKLEKIPLPVPPISEQCAIATALSDADALIEALDRLIVKKRAIKQATLQQLLTGQTRLPGFEGAWETKRLGELADVIGGGTPSSSIPKYWNGEVAWCTPTDITETSGKYLKETKRTISDYGLRYSAAILLPVGSLLVCTRATIGEMKLSTVPVSTNQGFKSLIVRQGTSNEFLYYKLSTMKQEMLDRSSGSTFLEISKKSLSDLELASPSIKEQTAIATVLSDMDAEIEALERRRDKARQIKQGMMQQLLTGRVRLVKPEASV